jgi:cellulose synthase/poly-beta-1,6-N-acetylglucosamine synthase-like glycosyltransferase
MIDYGSIKILLYFMLSVNAYLFVHLTIKTYVYKKIEEKIKYYEDYILENFENENSNMTIKSRIFRNSLVNVFKRVTFTFEQRKILRDIIHKNKIDEYYIKKLKSKSKLKRREATQFLAFIDESLVRKEIQSAFEKEKDYNVKMYICYAITTQKMVEMIPLMIKSLEKAPESYQKRVRSLLISYKDGLYNYILKYTSSDDHNIKKLIIEYSELYPYDILKDYLLVLIDNEDNLEIKRMAVKSLAKFYYEELYENKFLENEDVEIKKMAIEGLSQTPVKENILRISKYIAEESTYDVSIYAISRILRNVPKLIPYVVELFENESNEIIKEGYAKILSIRIEYFMYKLSTNEKEIVKDLLVKILVVGKTSELISFLNKNNIEEIEKQIIPVLKRASRENENVKKQFSQYLREDLLKKINLEKIEPEELPRFESSEFSKMMFQGIILAISILFIPFFFFREYGITVQHFGFTHTVRNYIVFFNYFFAYYFIFVNSFYLILLFFSGIQKYRQETLWKMKDYDFLYKDKFLPTVSIIAPAFNEESNIIESVNSLLNLNYPDYELIVVNDGSKDKTLEKLIKYFFLEKVDYIIGKELKTRPIRGVYVNPNIPNLIIIDKENGGKADSLNVGINMSKKEYVCGIDADSILEKDALLKLAALSLDTSKMTVAMGGNIIPVNGCKVKKGTFEAINIPDNIFARFQIIEYMRSFLGGRLGWSYLNSLLIISGAFGLFNREIIIKSGGYLTESEKYQKNTVGEDMELVVRVSSELRKNKIPHKIEYSYNANCWTEVPEKLKILYRQRDRWQRGLIDILNFHRKKILNPRYGNMGLIGLPYFLIMEIFGPLLEFQGYIALFFAVIFGLVNVPIVTLLFTASILFGMSVSLVALIIAEDEVNYFSFKETMILIIYAMLDVFGFRQFISFIRFSGFFTSMKSNQGWGKMERKGFKKED